MVDLRTRDMTFCLAHAQARARGTTRVARALVCRKRRDAGLAASGAAPVRRGAETGIELAKCKAREMPGAWHDARREGARVLYLRRGARWRPLGQRRCAAARKRALSLQDAKMRPRSARHDTRREGARVLYLRRGARWRPLGQRRGAAARKRALSLQDAKMRPRSAARWPRLARPGHPCYWCCSRLRTALLPPPAQRRVHRLALNVMQQRSAAAISGLSVPRRNGLERWI